MEKHLKDVYGFNNFRPYQKDIIQDSLGIQPKIVEKVVVKEKIVYKQSKKAKLNTYDDY